MVEQNFHDMNSGIRVKIDERGKVSEITKYLALPRLMMSASYLTFKPITITIDGVSYPIADYVRAGAGGTYPGT